jgi:hypothetical protein
MPHEAGKGRPAIGLDRLRRGDGGNTIDGECAMLERGGGVVHRGGRRSQHGDVLAAQGCKIRFARMRPIPAWELVAEGACTSARRPPSRCKHDLAGKQSFAPAEGLDLGREIFPAR